MEVQDLTTEVLSKSEIVKPMLSVITHRQFRGKNLGTSYTNEQKQAIQNGTFEDIYVGDYWVINDVHWRIVDIDYFTNIPSLGNDDVNSHTCHHVIIIPDEALVVGSCWNSENNNFTKGYLGSAIYKNDITHSLSKFEAAFGSENLKNMSMTISNSIGNTDGLVYSVTVTDQKCFSPKISQIYETGSLLLSYHDNKTMLTNRPLGSEYRRFSLFKYSSFFNLNILNNCVSSDILPSNKHYIGLYNLSPMLKNDDGTAQWRPYACLS